MQDALEAMMPYIDRQLARGTRLCMLSLVTFSSGHFTLSARHARLPPTFSRKTGRGQELTSGY